MRINPAPHDMKPFTDWIIVILSCTALIGGFFSLKQITSGAGAEFALGNSTTSPQAAHVESLPSRQLLPGVKEYRSNDYHFSLKYPGDITPRESHDRGYGMTVAFQNSAGEQGFEIYVTPINGTKITDERFLMDEPSGVRKDQTETSVDGAQALAFHGFDAAMGQTYEVWFIHGPFLYEVSTYKELEPGLIEILSTWRP
jgi:hypothetical protein